MYFISDTNEEKINFILSNENISQITASRYFSRGGNGNNYQLQIRICQLESKVTSLNEVTDYFPQGLNIHVNTRRCLLTKVRPISGIGTGQKFAIPIDCTRLIKLTPNTENTISIKWTPDTKTYAVIMCIVNKLTANTLYERLVRKERRNIEETRNDIIKMFQNNNDTDLVITSFTLSLICPITKMQMTAPAKSSQCEHLECFDAWAFIRMNKHYNKWRCPICNLNCLYDDLKIDDYILSILHNPIIKTGSIGKIIIKPNGFCTITGK